MTPRFRNPLLWLLRFRHRCGYGVHSPFAFSLLENVVYERLPYYAFQELDACLKLGQRFRVKRYLHLLFRLSNFQHSSQILLFGAEDLERDYLTRAVPKATVHEVSPYDKSGARINSHECGEWGMSRIEGDGTNRLVFLASPCDEVVSFLTSKTMLLLANPHNHMEWWQSLPSCVSFDLYDLGIAFFDPKYNKQQYIVNF